MSEKSQTQKHMHVQFNLHKAPENANHHTGTIKRIRSCLETGAGKDGLERGMRNFGGGDGNVLYIDCGGGFTGHIHLSKLKCCTLTGFSFSYIN